ncbi:hypothetical protein M8C21_008147 [Ambrosia artemisiifolia]|uniref:Uncharacterized protein n=1 Tax=Ambrosia artemisiifolia TaxID=4212 RepID=A0AAD5BT39_AMBAR|nr:hypothetical protein M8C21_008147 [Ambrosia artemisiifolia]
MEFFGAGLAFPKLEILSFKRMLGWEKWSTNGEAMFPCLQELHLESCRELVEVSLGALPPLNVLEVDNCDSVVLVSLVQVIKAVINLKIEYILGLNDVVWRGVMEHLGEVEELRIEMCNLLTSLMTLNVRRCNKMEHLSCPDNIQTLEVFGCGSLATISLPTGVLKLTSFKVTGCEKLLEREWGGQNMNNNRIEILGIYNWSNLKSIELSYFYHLTELRIVSCENLKTFPDNKLANLTSLKHLEIRKCPRMDARFPCGVWPPNLHSLKIGKLKKPISKWNTQNFPTSLMSLELYGFKDEVSSCSYFSDLLPSSLTYLGINGFEKLESIKEGIQHLTSLQNLYVSGCPNLKNVSYPQQLQHITFRKCPEMMDLPEDLLPSLLSLRIGGGCPKLKERCSYLHLRGQTLRDLGRDIKSFQLRYYSVNFKVCYFQHIFFVVHVVVLDFTM